MRFLSYVAISLAVGAPVAAEQIQFTDHEGREVTLPAPAQRIASIPMPIASILIAIDGATDRLIGMHPGSKSAIVDGILGKAFPEAKDIPAEITSPNFIPNVEELARLNPDLVIQWAGRGPDYVDPITNAGLNLMTITYGDETMTREFMTMAATAMGKTERIEEMIEWRAKVQADIEARTAGLSDEERPTVLYLLRAMDNLQASGTEGNYNAWYHILAGGKNAADDMPGGWADVSVEQVATWNPDVILLNTFEGDLTIDRVLNDPILSLTKAAQNGRVYKMPMGGYRWDPPSAESPLTWMWTAELLHPELFDYDLRAEMRSAYQTLYGYELTDEEIDSILWMDMQGGQANYDQFAKK